MVTVSVGHTADTLGATDTDGGIATAACIVGHITELTLLTDTLLTGAITITEAAHAARAVSCTHRCLSPTTRIVCRITDLALLSDTLATVTITIALTADTADTLAIVDTDGGIPAATGVGAKGTELALIGHTLAQARLVTLAIVCTFNTDSSPTEVCTHRGLSTAACPIGYITDLTTASNTLT